FGGLLIYHVDVVRSSVDAGEELASVDSRVLLGASTQLDLLDQGGLDAQRYRALEGGEAGYLDLYRTRMRAFEDTLRALRSLELRGGQREALDKLSQDWGGFRGRFVASEVIGPRLLGRVADEGDPWSEFQAGIEALKRRTRALRVASQASVTSQMRAIADEAERAVAAGWIGVVVAVALSGLLAILIVRSITLPLHGIQQGSRALAGGDFDVRVEERGGPELAEVARTFNEMATRLGELDRAKHDFLAKVSHDLKTPLASIHEVQRLLLDRVPGDLTEKQERLLHLGLGNAERLSEMISKLLELARLEAGVQEYDLGRVDLVRLCDETATGLRERMKGRREIRFERPDRPVWIEGDSNALRRVMENLIENALKYAEEGPIDLWIERADDEADGGSIRVHVRDRGPGIPEEERERVFQRFYQVNGTRPGSSGLGLAICREIVVAHGGRISVRDAPGGGCVFSFGLTPVKEAHAISRA
ncbi:MAG: ATP-binding protein, partial [Gemmatimonadota bacterium]